MPEGPEVALYATALNKFLSTKTLCSLEYDKNSRYEKNGLPHFDELTRLLPLKINKVSSKGKKIIIELSNHIYILSSLGLEGRWCLEPKNHSNLWLTIQDEFGGVQKIYYDDSRHFGEVKLVLSKNELDKKLSKIGPDMLFEEVTHDMWMKVVSDKRLGNKQICDFLMDQQYFSGCGNYLKSMTLYQAKVRPNATLKELSEEDHQNIRTNLIRNIKDSYKAQGASLKTFVNFDQTRGDFEVIVYGKSTDPYGNPVITSTFKDNRTTHWVREVQIRPTPFQEDESELDIEKLKLSYGRGKDTYTVAELRAFAKERKLKTDGKKADLVERLLNYKESS